MVRTLKVPAALLAGDEATSVSLSAPGGEVFAAMMYLAALAYPESHAKRDRFVLAMKAHCLRHARRQRRITREHAAVIVTGITPQQQRGRLGQGFGRVAHRIRMADAALPSFLELLSSRSFRITVNSTLTDRLGQVSGDRRETFRTWKATRPVLHLALALRTILQEPRELGVELLYEPTWVPRALKFAEHVLLPTLRTSPLMHRIRAIRLLPSP
jgi:hypothetical protein